MESQSGSLRYAVRRNSGHACAASILGSSVIIGYLAGQDELKDACQNIIASAERGELEIIVATMATVEVAYLEGLSDEDSELMIAELFSRDYVIPVSIDMRVAAIARG